MTHSRSIQEAIVGIFATTANTVVAITQINLNPDIIAVLGSTMATVIAVIEARNKDRSLGHTVSVTVASMVVGSIVPGVFIWNYYPQKIATLSWHSWAAGGFVCGLFGWSVVAAALALRGKIPAFLMWLLRLKFNIPPSEKDKP